MDPFLVEDPGVISGEAIDELNRSLGLLAPLPGTFPLRACRGWEGVDPGVLDLERRIGLLPRRQRLRDAGNPAAFRGAGVLAAR